MTDSNFKNVSGIPLAVIMIFLGVYGGLFVLFQVDIGVSMVLGFLAAGIFYFLKYMDVTNLLKKEEDE